MLEELTEISESGTIVPGSPKVKHLLALRASDLRKRTTLSVEPGSAACVVIDHWSSCATISYIGIVLVWVTPTFEHFWAVSGLSSGA